VKTKVLFVATFAVGVIVGVISQLWLAKIMICRDFNSFHRPSLAAI
jgi:hypothetical protein